jgi:diguanylate cyclase (GGDEF)-like protein
MAGTDHSASDDRLAHLDVLGRALDAATSAGDLLELVAEEALRALPACSLSISRWDRADNSIRVLINAGELSPRGRRRPDDERYPVADYPPTAALLREGRSYLVRRDDEHADRGMLDLLERLDRGSQIGAAIVIGGRVWGELWATTKPDDEPFGEDDMRLFEAVAGRVGLALERAENLAGLSRLAWSDPLTGLANRRAFEHALADALADGAGLAVVLVDIDGLKAVNDSHGHLAGDRAIVGVGRALCDLTAGIPGALVARIGGDEFCAVLPRADAEGAAALIAGLPDVVRRRTDGAVRVTAGFGTRREGAGSIAELLSLADGRLYARRSAGGLPPPSRERRGPHDRRSRRAR